MRARALGAMTIVGALIACEPSASEPRPSESALPSESAAASVAPSSTPLPEGWQEATFGDGPGPAIARDLAPFEDGFVAVGVEFAEPLPNLGPTPPHEGRIWRSADGWTWEDVTPTGELENVDLAEVFVRSDGTMVAMGLASEPSVDGTGVEPSEGAAWQSSDGQTWQTIAVPVPGQQVRVEVGAQGYVALAFPQLQNQGAGLWFSPDGSTWQPVESLLDGSFDHDAGGEGFAVVGTTSDDTDAPAYITASGDGQTWVQSTDAPVLAGYAAALGGDWVTLTWDFGASVTSWFSANGLDWAQAGTVAVESLTVDPQTSCSEFPVGLASTGSIIVMSTIFSFPCSEGGFFISGRTFLTTDGTAWNALPFPVGTVGEFRSGSRVDAAEENDTVVVLVGELDGQAAFWTMAVTP